ncbi:hypothetical protein DRN32_05395 [Thermococci archaeon]|nr:MAG: hypothetical protein DRN32_05395 [Thermococci archaeon]
MNVPKKVTDFIVLEEGNIGRKAATVTGAALAASVLSTVLAQTVLAWDHCDAHSDYYEPCCHDQGAHSDCYGCAKHVNSHADRFGEPC